MLVLTTSAGFAGGLALDVLEMTCCTRLADLVRTCAIEDGTTLLCLARDTQLAGCLTAGCLVAALRAGFARCGLSLRTELSRHTQLAARFSFLILELTSIARCAREFLRTAFRFVGAPFPHLALLAAALARIILESARCALGARRSVVGSQRLELSHHTVLASPIADKFSSAAHHRFAYRRARRRQECAWPALLASCCGSATLKLASFACFADISPIVILEVASNAFFAANFSGFVLEVAGRAFFTEGCATNRLPLAWRARDAGGGGVFRELTCSA